MGYYSFLLFNSTQFNLRYDIDLFVLMMIVELIKCWLVCLIRQELVFTYVVLLLVALLLLPFLFIPLFVIGFIVLGNLR